MEATGVHLEEAVTSTDPTQSSLDIDESSRASSTGSSGESVENSWTRKKTKSNDKHGHFNKKTKLAESAESKSKESCQSELGKKAAVKANKSIFDFAKQNKRAANSTSTMFQGRMTMFV